MPYFNRLLLYTLLNNTNIISITKKIQTKINLQPKNNNKIYDTNLSKKLKTYLS